MSGMLNYAVVVKGSLTIPRGREFREYAILKAHSELLEGMKENEAIRHRQVLEVNFQTHRMTLKQYDDHRNRS
jgi:hypothetical protein